MRSFAVLRTALYMSCFVALCAWAAVAVRRYDEAIGISLPDWLAAVGYAAMACGAVLGLLCGASFAIQGRGTPAPFDPPVAFVASGPYRLVRNPMYLGGVALLAGYGLVVGSFAVLLLAASGAGMAHLFVVLVEEPALERRFGERYLAYRRLVNRWLPRRPRSHVAHRGHDSAQRTGA